MHGNRARPSVLLQFETLYTELLLSFKEETRQAVNLHAQVTELRKKFSFHSALKRLKKSLHFKVLMLAPFFNKKELHIYSSSALHYMTVNI